VGFYNELNELDSKTRQLPKVDEQGKSECPFAEELYADKEEALANVERESGRLEEYLDWVEQEIERCQRNLDRIRFDRNGLDLDEAREQYEAALESQQHELNTFIHQKKRLNDLMIRKNQLLTKAQDKRHTWPLVKPKQKDHFNPEAVLNAVLANRSGNYHGRAPGKPGFNRELNGLMELGPLG